MIAYEPRFGDDSIPNIADSGGNGMSFQMSNKTLV